MMVSTSATTVYMIIFMFALFSHIGQLSAAKIDSSCVEQITYHGDDFTKIRQLKEKCCDYLEPLAKSDASEANNQLCDAIIQDLKWSFRDDAGDLFEAMIRYCRPVRGLLSLDSTRCNNLPHSDNYDECLTPEMVDPTDAKPDAKVVKNCCDSLESIARVISSTRTANVLCDDIVKRYSPWDSVEAKQMFNNVTHSCSGTARSIPFESTSCAKIVAPPPEPEEPEESLARS